MSAAGNLTRNRSQNSGISSTTTTRVWGRARRITSAVLGPVPAPSSTMHRADSKSIPFTVARARYFELGANEAIIVPCLKNRLVMSHQSGPAGFRGSVRRELYGDGVGLMGFSGGNYRVGFAN